MEHNFKLLSDSPHFQISFDIILLPIYCNLLDQMNKGTPYFVLHIYEQFRFF